MSRIGRLPVAIPAGVDIVIDGQTVTVTSSACNGAADRNATAANPAMHPFRNVEPMPPSPPGTAPAPRAPWNRIPNLVSRREWFNHPSGIFPDILASQSARIV